MNVQNLYKITAEIEFKNNRKSKIFFRVRAKDEYEAFGKIDISIAKIYGDDILDGEFLDCKRIA